MIIPINFNLEITIHKDPETGIYVSKCNLFQLVSQGSTEEEAVRAIQSATKLYLEHCSKNAIWHHNRMATN